LLHSHLETDDSWKGIIFLALLFVLAVNLTKHLQCAPHGSERLGTRKGL
jgi:hypothetical protein